MLWLSDQRKPKATNSGIAEFSSAAHRLQSLFGTEPPSCARRSFRRTRHHPRASAPCVARYSVCGCTPSASVRCPTVCICPRASRDRGWPPSQRLRQPALLAGLSR